MLHPLSLLCCKKLPRFNPLLLYCKILLLHYSVIFQLPRRCQTRLQLPQIRQIYQLDKELSCLGLTTKHQSFIKVTLKVIVRKPPGFPLPICRSNIIVNTVQLSDCVDPVLSSLHPQNVTARDGFDFLSKEGLDLYNKYFAPSSGQMDHIQVPSEWFNFIIQLWWHLIILIGPNLCSLLNYGLIWLRALPTRNVSHLSYLNPVSLVRNLFVLRLWQNKKHPLLPAQLLLWHQVHLLRLTTHCQYHSCFWSKEEEGQSPYCGNRGKEKLQVKQTQIRL